MKDINIEKYTYTLPDERIAKYPLKQRDESKLLVYSGGAIIDHVFRDLPGLLPENSNLYFNNTRVLYARLPFQKPTGAKIEIFCLEPHTPEDYAINLESTNKCQWKCLVGNLKKWKSGQIRLVNDEIDLEAEIIERNSEHVIIEFKWNSGKSFAEILEKAGEVPIPPYLNRNSEENDKQTYQTIYSRIEGSVAAPTAGLHFTDGVFKQLGKRNIKRHEVTLHVGAGTFRPVSSDTIAEHEMHREYITIPRTIIESLLDNTKHTTAVGTTTVRTLESLYWIGKQILQKMPKEPKMFFVAQWEPYKNEQNPEPSQALEAILEYLDKHGVDEIVGNTQIIIVPGYKHKIVQSLVTNFHQPRSTLLLLLASFVGDDWKNMYDHALKNNYRFLSYGDSCFIVSERKPR